MKKVILLFSTLLLIPLVLAAESPPEQTVAAMEKKLSTVSGEERADTLNALANRLYQLSPGDCIRYGEEALALSEKLGCPDREAAACTNIARGFMSLQNSQKARQYYNRALEIYKKTGGKEKIAHTLNHLGAAYRWATDYRKAMNFHRQALKIAGEAGLEKIMIASLRNIGIVYSDVDSYEKSLDYHLQALKKAETLGTPRQIAEESLHIGRLYSELMDDLQALKHFNNALAYFKNSNQRIMATQTHDAIGAVYLRSRKNQRALDHFLKSLKIAREINYKIGIAVSYENISTVHRVTGKFQQALTDYQKALSISRELGSQSMIATALGNIGYIYRSLKDYPQALSYFRMALGYRDELPNERSMVHFLHAAGVCCIQLEQYRQAEAYLKDSVNTGIRINRKDMLSACYKSLSLLYQETSKPRKALEYFKLYHQKERDFLANYNTKRINRLQAKYEAQKNKEIQELILSKARITRNAFIAGFILVTIILILLFKRYIYLFSFWKKEKHVGRFRLLDKLGTGAMGAVYKAHSLTKKSDIAAVKVLRDELFGDPNSKTRFKREATIIDKLSHPNIVNIYEIGMAKDKLFIAMEYLEGRTLEDVLTSGPRPPFQVCLHIMRQVSAAVAYIHSRKVIHRDLKPGNIMLITKDGDTNFVKLLDFGLAKSEYHTQLTLSGNLVGTLEYMAPEQVVDAISLPANDIFSMGVIFYRMLSGEKPFTGETVVEIMRKIVTKEPPPISQLVPETPAELSRLIMQMIEKEHGRRPTSQTVEESLNQTV